MYLYLGNFNKPCCPRSKERGNTVSPLNSYFCQKWNLLGSQPKTKKVQLWSFFELGFFNFSWEKQNLRIFKKYIVVSAQKSCLTYLLNFFFFEFFGGENCLLSWLAVLVILVIMVKVVCPWLLCLLSLILPQCWNTYSDSWWKSHNKSTIRPNTSFQQILSPFTKILFINLPIKGSSLVFLQFCQGNLLEGTDNKTIRKEEIYWLMFPFRECVSTGVAGAWTCRSLGHHLLNLLLRLL